VSGGTENSAGDTNVDFATVGGGSGNSANGNYSTVGGGKGIQANGNYSTVAGGNAIAAYGDWSTVGGGQGSVAAEAYSTVGGGSNNTAGDRFTTVGGGGTNTASGWGSTVGGGIYNTISGDFGVVPGGDHNVATNSAFAAGHRAKAIYQGSFIWADSNDFDFTANIANKVRFRCTSGFDIITGIDAFGSQTAGVYVSPGGSGWNSICDRNAKEDFQQANVREVLEAVAALPMSTWKYKTQAGGIRHMGPMAQDFHTAFKLGEDDKHINNIDEEGVALAAIQGLNQKLEDARAENAELKARLEQLLNSKVNGGEK
jgi:hypothetical protein